MLPTRQRTPRKATPWLPQPRPAMRRRCLRRGRCAGLSSAASRVYRDEHPRCVRSAYSSCSSPGVRPVRRPSLQLCRYLGHRWGQPERPSPTSWIYVSRCSRCQHVQWSGSLPPESWSSSFRPSPEAQAEALAVVRRERLLAPLPGTTMAPASTPLPGRASVWVTGVEGSSRYELEAARRRFVSRIGASAIGSAPTSASSTSVPTHSADSGRSLAGSSR